MLIYGQYGVTRRGIIANIEYQCFCPFVGIGSPHPLPRKRVWLPPIGYKCGGPNSDEGAETLVLYVNYNPSTRNTILTVPVYRVQ